MTQEELERKIVRVEQQLAEVDREMTQIAQVCGVIPQGLGVAMIRIRECRVWFGDVVTATRDQVG